MLFTEAIAVDLHPSFKSEALTLKTKSGKQITLTGEHMTIVNQSYNQELVPARLIKPGSLVEVINDDGLTILDEVIEVSAADPSSIKGLANVITGTETILVNGIVGSTLAESSTRTIGMKIAR